MPEPFYRVLVFGMDYPPAISGTATYARSLVEGLVARGQQVQVLTSQDAEGRWREFDDGQAYPIRRFRRARTVPGRYALARRQLAATLAESRPDCLWLTNGMATRVTGLLRGLPRLGVPVISCVRGTDIRTRLPGRGLVRRLESIPQRRCYRHSGAIAAASEYLRQMAIAKGVDGSRIFVNRSAVEADGETDLASGHGELSQDKGSRGSDEVVLTVARLSTQKRVDVALRAMALVLAHRPKARHVIVGDGPELGRLKQLAGELGISERVCFTGALAPRSAALIELYRHARLFAMTSVGEGLGNVYLEAGSLGLPCIGASDAGVPEVIVEGETGYLVDPDDAEQLAARIEALLADSELCRSMGRRARARIAEAFSLEAMAEVNYGVLRAVVESGSPAV